jgi:hypothetical protein
MPCQTVDILALSKQGQFQAKRARNGRRLAYRLQGRAKAAYRLHRKRQQGKTRINFVSYHNLMSSHVQRGGPRIEARPGKTKRKHGRI